MSGKRIALLGLAQALRTALYVALVVLFIPDSPPKIVGMAFVGLQQVWGVNRGC